MADQRISTLAAQTGSGLDTSDLFYTVDVSDTTDDPTGTAKKLTTSELAKALVNLKLVPRVILYDAGASKSNDASSNSIFTTGTGMGNIALAVGDLLNLKANGIYTNATGSTQALSYAMFGGNGVTIINSFSYPAQATNASFSHNFYFDIWMLCKAVGSIGALTGTVNLSASYNISIASTNQVFDDSTGTTSNFITGGLTLFETDGGKWTDIKLTMPTASASLSWTMKGITMTHYPKVI